ncbi:MAG: adenosylmethionine decarboxylase [Dehalococcoidia bacterium]|nr:adenosylmethionine decarboxylase [Dehalococcoidia bacterium]
MNALGRHLLLELRDCNWEVLDDLDYIRNCLRDTAEEIGADVVNECFYQFSPHGITGVVIISESHICIHTWPEHRYAAVDVFTCGSSVEPERAVKRLVEKLGSKDPSFLELERGILQSDQVSCELR